MCRVNKYELVCEKVEGYNVDFMERRMRDSGDIARFINEYLKSDRFTVEHFMVFMLDTKLNLQGYAVVSKGNLDSSPVHPREVFQHAVATPKCGAIIVAHNHPSGDPTPSPQDVEVTERLNKAGEIIGIKMLDHVVVGNGVSISMKSEGYL